MKDIEVVIKFYRGDIFREWLQRLWDVHGNHGNELAKLLGTPRDGKPGMTDNVASADRILLAAEKAGWIKRAETASPSMEQKFFGVGGMRGNHNHPEARSAVEFWWEPIRNCKEIVDFLKTGTV